MIKGFSIRDYKILDVLKTRPFSDVNACIVEDQKSHEMFLLKSFLLEQSKKGDFEKLVVKWGKVTEATDYAMRIKGFFYEDPNAFVLTEFCEGGDLESLIKKKKLEKTKFSEYEISKIIHNVFSGLRTLFEMSIVYADLKPCNIWISKNGVYKIAEFNMPRLLADASFADPSRSSAPEIYLGEEISFPADSYSVGVILYELMALTPPFSGRDILNIQKNKYPPLNSNSGYSEGLVKLDSQLMSLDPSLRPSANDVLENPLLSRARMQGVEVDVHDHRDEIAMLQKSITTLESRLAQSSRMAEESARKIEDLKQARETQDSERLKTLEKMIETVESACITAPDYTQPKSLGLSFQAPENGWVMGTLYLTPNAWIDTQVNGKSTSWNGTTFILSQGYGYVPFSYPLRKGDNFSIIGGSSHNAVFYPCIKIVKG